MFVTIHPLPQSVLQPALTVKDIRLMNNVMTETISIQMDARTVLLTMDTLVIQILQMFVKQLVEMIYEQIQKIVMMETIF